MAKTCFQLQRPRNAWRKRDFETHLEPGIFRQHLFTKQILFVKVLVQPFIRMPLTLTMWTNKHRNSTYHW